MRLFKKHGIANAIAEALWSADRDCVVLVDEDGRVLDLNQAALRLFGPSEGAVLPNLISTSLTPAGLCSTGLREVSAIRADGGRFPAEMTMTRLVTADCALFLGQIREISAFKIQDEVTPLTFDGDSVAIFILNPQMELLSCNAAAISMFLFSAAEDMIACSRAGRFPSSADRSVIGSRASQSFSRPQPIRLHRKDGTSFLAVGRFAGDHDDAGYLKEIHCSLIHSPDTRLAQRKIARLTSQLLHAQHEERRKLSHDLHDSAGQTLSALSMTLALVKARWAEMPLEAAEYMTHCDELVQDCVRDIRTVSYSLHPPLLEELGIGAALRWYVEGFSQRSAIFVSVEIVEELGRFSTELETVVFRIVQELLTNVHRHSGSKTAQVKVWREPARLVIRISDQGCGVSKQITGSVRPDPGVGLASIRQQLSHIKGHLEITADPDTRLTAYIPVNRNIE